MVVKSSFSIYDAFAGKNSDQAALHQRKLQNMVRVDPNMFKDIATNSNFIPSDESLAEEVVRMNIKIIRLKASRWVEYVSVLPTIQDWQRGQDALLSSEENPIDQLLSGQMDFLDVNDLASVNLVLQESAQIHSDIVKRQKALEVQYEYQTRVGVKLQIGGKVQSSADTDEQPHKMDGLETTKVYQTVSATSIQELNNNLYVHLTNSLTGKNLTKKILEDQQNRQNNIKDLKESELISPGLLKIEPNLVQSLNTLRYIYGREAKTRILYCLNYFRAIQKRLMLDLREASTRERVLGDVPDPLIMPEEADSQITDTYNMVLANANLGIHLADKGKFDDLKDDEVMIGKAGPPPGFQSGPAKLQRKMTRHHTKVQQQILMKSNQPMDQATEVELILQKKRMLQDSMSKEIKDQGNLEITSQLAEQDSFSLVDIKKTRYKGRFHDKHLSTCPVLPRFHATFGEPSEISGQFVDFDREQREEPISKDSLKLLGRVDHIEIDPLRKEVFVKDDFNIYILYECVLTDMQILEEEILRIGSYFISRLEDLYDTEVDKVCHKKDRQQVLTDLLECEADFQFKKVMLVQVFMDAYEHICDPVEQQRVTKIVVDLCARRPRLSLDSCFYFKDAYAAESECIDKQIDLFQIVMENQIKLEKQENSHLHEALNLSYNLAQMKMRDGWQYNNPDDYLTHLIEVFNSKALSGQIKLNMEDDDELGSGNAKFDAALKSGFGNKESEGNKNKSLSDDERDSNNKDGRGSNNREKKGSSSQLKLQQKVTELKAIEMRYNEQDLDQDAFTRLLGLPKVTIENLFSQVKERDEMILDIMNEHSHFVNLIEGYPDLMSLRHSGKRIIQSNSEEESRPGYVNPDAVHEFNLKFDQVSTRAQEVSILDFFSDALLFVSKLNSTLVSCYQELHEALRPHDNTLACILETEIYVQAIRQYREMQMYLSGERTEFKGQQYIQDEMVLGSADKMMFYMKDFHSSLNRQMKSTLNPFIVAKLDLTSIKAFKFISNVNKQDNPYLQKRSLLMQGKEVSIAIAEHKFLHNPSDFQTQFVSKYGDEYQDQNQIQNQNLKINVPGQGDKGQLKVKPPGMLTLACNSIELLRLRSELILCVSESIELQKIYDQQVLVCKRQNMKANYQEGLAFEHGILRKGEVNYVDDGPASMLEIGLAISEVDPAITSNLNFRNPDAFKMLITTSGLEELRCALHYQLMQKQALIVATRINQSLMDIHLRAIKELRLVRMGFIVPNMVIQVDDLFKNALSEGMSDHEFDVIQQKFLSNLYTKVASCLISVNAWKNEQRTNLTKKFQDMLVFIDKNHPQREVKLRVLRHYKVCLFNQYINQILSQIYQDSVKYNLINQVQKLRRINSYFQFNPSSMNIVPIGSVQKDPKKKTPEEQIDCYYSILFNLETNDLMENLSAWYQLEKYQQQATRIMHYEDSKQKKNFPPREGEYMEISNNRDTKFQQSNFLAIDFKKGIQHLDIFSLPSSSTLIQIPSTESLFPRPSFDILEQKKFLNENVEGELIFQQILPKLTDIENFDKIYPLEKLKLTKILRYYSMIENIINIELSILKFSFSSKVITEMDNSIQFGMPFFISRSANLSQKNNSNQQESHQSDFKDHFVPASGLLAIINSGKVVDEISLTGLGRQLNKDARELENTTQTKQAKKNLMTAKIVKYLYQKTKLKADIGEELQQIAIRIKEVMGESKRLAERKFQQQSDLNQENKLLQTSFDLEYLELYQEIRYLQIISTIQRVGEYFQQKKYLKAAKAVNDTILSVSKRDHIRIILTNGSAHVNSSDIDSHRIRIDPNSLCPFFGDYYEGNNFSKCVFPVLSDKALEPPEMTMLESIYIGNSEIDYIKKEIIAETDKSTDVEGGKKPKKSILLNKQGGSVADQNFIVQRRIGQFVGAAVPTQPFILTNFQPIQTYLLCIDKVQRDYLSQNLKLMDDALNDFLQIIANENLEDSSILPKLKLLNLSQLQTSRRFLTEQIECRQLKTGILCFLGHELPSRLIQNERVMNYLNSIFKKDLLWKILMEKDIQRDYMDDRYKTKYQREELRKRKLEIEQEIFQLQKVDERKITDFEVSKATNLQIQALQNEHKYMRFNMLLDQILFERAQKVVIQQEIEIHLIKAAVRTLDAECIAIANCLKNQAKEIEAHIHPFQQFTVTLYDRVDPLSHLDPINKISYIQQFLTRLKNRGTEVETLTSGPGYVFTLKDINDCVGTLTKGLLKFSEIEMRQRCELFSKREQHYLNLLYIKDQEITQLDNRVNQQSKSIDKIVNSRLLEKGNSIVFELDQTSRTLRMFKDHINMFETEVRRQVDGEFKNKMLYLESKLALKCEEFNQFRTDQTNMLLEKITKDTDVLVPFFNKRKLQYQTADQTPAKYQLPRETDQKQEQPVEKVKKGLMPRGVKPEPTRQFLAQNNNSQNNEPSYKLQDLQQFVENPPEKSNVVFMYDEQSSNDNSSIRLPKQLQQVYDYTEAQARQELAQIHKYTIKAFYFNKMKEVIIRQKFETELQTLQKMVSNNQLLNQKMAESQKRESILRQELMLTQEALSVAERTRDKQKEEIVKLETEKMRLMNFKQQKSKRLDELEQQATKYEIFQKIDMDKLIQVLYKQQSELKNLRTGKSIFEVEIQNTILKNKEELKTIQQKARTESKVKQDAMDKLGHMRTEMQALEVSKGSATELWKRKFYEALDICQELKEQNEYLTLKSQELAQVSLNLLGTFHQGQVEQESRTFSQREFGDIRSAEKSQFEFKNAGGSGMLDAQNLNELSKKIESVVQSTRTNDPLNKQRILLGKKVGLPLQSQSAYLGVKRDGKSRDSQRRGHSLLKAVQADEDTRNYFRQSANLFPSANMENKDLNPLSKVGLETTNAVSGDFISSYGKSTRIGFPPQVKLDSYGNENSNFTIIGSRQQIAKSVGRDFKAQISNLAQSTDTGILKGPDIFQKKPPSKMADIMNQQPAHPDMIISPNEERKRSSMMNANLRANKF